MSETWTNVEIKMPGEKDYAVIQVLIKNYFDDEEHWPVEEYDETNFLIRIEEVLATQDDVVGFAKVLNDQIIRIASKREPETREKIEQISFAMHGTTQFYNSGEQIDYIIEKKNKNLTIRETENYTFWESRAFEDYEDFCNQVGLVCFGVRDLVSEDEFDPNCEYAATYTEIFTDETPSYCDPYPVEKYMEAGKVYPVDD